MHSNQHWKSFRLTYKSKICKFYANWLKIIFSRFFRLIFEKFSKLIASFDSALQGLSNDIQIDNMQILCKWAKNILCKWTSKICKFMQMNWKYFFDFSAIFWKFSKTNCFIRLSFAGAFEWHINQKYANFMQMNLENMQIYANEPEIVFFDFFGLFFEIFQKLIVSFDSALQGLSNDI